MTPDRWKQIEEIFNKAIELPLNQRALFLEGLCGDDKELFSEVESLLQQDDETGAMLKTIISHAADSLSKKDSVDFAGKHIGPYRITGLIGQGGMAEVYKAVRDDDQYQKQVAIKVIRHDRVSFLIGRFWHERQILANLEHSNIARFLEGGTTDEGIPYLVMEYIEGDPITIYCHKYNLTIRQRLELFKSVCNAVQYAHRNLVIHRDLKPSNILVTADGVPKLLDFGIAKLLNPDLAVEYPTATVTSYRMMTPEYASPEQVRGEQVTTATDVYSLGAVLYELLTNERPYHFDTRSFLEMERVICEKEPELPSAVVTRTHPTKKKLSREFGHELDSIVLKAMEKDSQSRYSTVAQFADDINRYLDGLPILARTSTFSYRAFKFARRHRTAVALAAFFVLVLASFATVMTIQASRIAKERDRANQVTEFLVNLFEVSNPSESKGNTITARELLNESTKKIERDLRDQPEVQAALMDTMGRVYRNLGLYSTSIPLLEKALKIRKETFGEESTEAASTMNILSEALYNAGKYEAAEPLARKALSIRRKILGNEHPDVADSLNSLGFGLFQSGDYDQCEIILREALAIRQKVFAAESVEVANSLNELGLVLKVKRKTDEAESLYRRALAIRRKLYGNNHPEVSTTLNNLGRLLVDKGNYDEAEKLLREAVELDRKILGKDHPDLAITMSSLGWTLREEKKFEEAEKTFRDALEIRKRALGDVHPAVGTNLYALGVVLFEKGDVEQGEVFLKDAQEVWKKTLPPQHDNQARVLLALGRVRLKKGDYVQAEKIFREVLEARQKNMPGDHLNIARAKGFLGESLKEQKRYAEAEPLMVESYRAYKAELGANHRDVIESAERLKLFYAAWGKPAANY